MGRRRAEKKGETVRRGKEYALDGPQAQEEVAGYNNGPNPRQTDDESSLLELKIVEKKWFNDGATMLKLGVHGATGTEGCEEQVGDVGRQRDEKTG